MDSWRRSALDLLATLLTPSEIEGYHRRLLALAATSLAVLVGCGVLVRRRSSSAAAAAHLAAKAPPVAAAKKAREEDPDPNGVLVHLRGLSSVCSMEDLPEALLTEIVQKITSTSDLNSLSLVSKQLYMIEGNQRGAIRFGSGLCTNTKALKSLCTRFPNLWKVEIDYSGCTPGHGKQLNNKEGNQRGDIRVGSVPCTATNALSSFGARFPNLWKVENDYNKGLSVFSSHCSSLTDLTLSFCSYIDDSGLSCLAYCKTLLSG